MTKEGIIESSQKVITQLVLPPCRVCGAKASGFHFGVISCEACKVFFRRSLTSKTSFKCKKNAQCKIQVATRAPCSFCRLEKCLSLGMSRQGIRKGRCTLERRAKTTREVRATEEQQEKEREEEMKKFKEKETELESLIQSVVKADQQFHLVSPEFLETVPSKQNKFMEYKQAKRLVYGPMKPVPHNVFQDVYQNCGLDIDDRRKRIELCAAKCVTEIQNYISFAKALPSFNDFLVNDRIILLRESYFEWQLLSSLKITDYDLGLYTCPSCGTTYDEDAFETYQDRSYKSFLRCGKLLKPLNLSDEELSLAKAVVVVNPYGCVMSCPKEHKEIERVQHQYLEALQYLLKKNRGNDRSCAKVLGRIISCVTEMKDAFYEFNKSRDSWLYLFPDIYCPAIGRELFESPDDPNNNQETLIKFLES